jgi:hypothetical protein
MQLVLVRRTRFAVTVALGVARTVALGVALGACASSTMAPAVSFSIALADGRTCRDASVVAVVVTRGATHYASFVCEDAEAPLTVSVDALPLTDSVSVLGLSAQGAVLYRGSFTASDLVGIDMAAVVRLYADGAR